MKRAVQQAFLQHYSVVPMKKGQRIKRKEIFEAIEETLRLSADNKRRCQITEWLREIGVVPVFSCGYRYFKGIKRKVRSTGEYS